MQGSSTDFQSTEEILKRGHKTAFFLGGKVPLCFPPIKFSPLWGNISSLYFPGWMWRIRSGLLWSFESGGRGAQAGELVRFHDTGTDWELGLIIWFSFLLGPSKCSFFDGHLFFAYLLLLHFFKEEDHSGGISSVTISESASLF